MTAIDEEFEVLDGVSPLAIRIMLACYYAANPVDDVTHRTWNSEAGTKIRDWLRENELVDEDYTVTERGKAWVNYICATPLPRKRWVMPEREDLPEAKPAWMQVGKVIGEAIRQRGDGDA